MCQQACPVSTEIPRVIDYYLQGDINTAGKILFENNPLSIITSLVCPHENQCQGNCILGRKGKPLNIGEIEHMVSLNYLKQTTFSVPEQNKGMAAIIGSGPAGLTIAFLLAQKGYQVTIFEENDRTGGVLRYGIPEFRLPKHIIDLLTEKLLELGVIIRYNTLIGPVLTLEDLFRDGYAAVFIGTGVWRSNKLGIKGESLGNVHFAIIDSGVGGLTVVKELQALLPKEDIIYFGDNKNVPYGNKSQEEIISLTKSMLDFLVNRNVKLVGIGCNTISTVLSLLAPQYDLKIIGIIDPIVKHIAKLTGDKIGLIATPFTIKSGYYNLSLANLNKSMEIIGEGCPNLAALIDQGNFTKTQLRQETLAPIANILEKGSVDTIILGCTHYPIVINYLQELYPDTDFINPALFQAVAIQDYLTDFNMLNDNKLNGNLKVFTSGETQNYFLFLDKLGIRNIEIVNKVE